MERLDDSVMRHVFGESTSPEEGVSKSFKAWMNEAIDTKDKKATVQWHRGDMQAYNALANVVRGT